MRMKVLGFPTNTEFFYFNKTKEIFNSADIIKPKDFLKHFTPAYTDSELDCLLPVGTLIKKSNTGNYTAKFEAYEFSEKTSAEAKASLLIILKRKNIIK